MGLAKRKTVKVSICMSVRNRANFVMQAITCVMQQYFSDFEFIIVDDASEDNTYEVIEEYSRNIDKIKLYKQDHHSYIDAHNKALSMATGEYIAWIDSDDVILENKLKDQAEFLDNNPDVDFVSCTTMLRQNVGLVQSIDFLDNEAIHKIAEEGTHLCTFIHFQSGMFRRTVLDEFKKGVYFFPEYESGQAGQGFVQTLYALGKKFANMSAAIYLYRVGVVDNSMTKNIDPVYSTKVNSMDLTKRNKEMLKLLKKHNEDKKPRKSKKDDA